MTRRQNELPCLTTKAFASRGIGARGTHPRTPTETLEHQLLTSLTCVSNSMYCNPFCSVLTSKPGCRASGFGCPLSICPSDLKTKAEWMNPAGSASIRP
jgi:hypothetical protein